MIGEIVVLLEDFDFNGKTYHPGHKWKIINTSYRGWDIEDDAGNRIYECLFIQANFEYLRELREEKLKELGI